MAMKLLDFGYVAVNCLVPMVMYLIIILHFLWGGAIAVHKCLLTHLCQDACYFGLFNMLVASDIQYQYSINIKNNIVPKMAPKLIYG